MGARFAKGGWRRNCRRGKPSATSRPISGRATPDQVCRKCRGVWRRRRDSNPRDPSGPTPLAGERLRPLGHVSVDAYIQENAWGTSGNLRKYRECRDRGDSGGYRGRDTACGAMRAARAGGIRGPRGEAGREVARWQREVPLTRQIGGPPGKRPAGLDQVLNRKCSTSPSLTV